MTMRILALALVVPLTACVTAAPPAAVISYAPVECHSKPDLSKAIPLPLAGRKKAGESVRSPIDAAAPCLVVAGAKSPYLVFALPAAANRLIDVGGVIERARVFPPSVAILDEMGQTRRTFQLAQFQNRGDRYSVQFIPEEGDRYVLVTVDQSLVGSSYKSIATGVNTTYLGYGGYWNSGVDETLSRTRSYQGSVVATVFDMGERQ